ncbi:MAG: ribonuclease III [Eubacterium sp.]|nr:ribonuclease III [Eubacterium sp.]
MNYEELDFGPLEERIGYHFKDPTLLRTALTHKSFASEYHVREVPQYERLEFLGDSILEYISSEALFERYPKLPEGELTKKRASLVCEYTLSQITKELGYGDYVILGKGEDLTGGRERPSILCDLFESVLGAIYLDGGMEPAKTYVERHLLTDLEHKTLFTDAKTILQEYAQSNGLELTYELLDQSGPDHLKVYTSRVLMGGTPWETGQAHSIKGAQMEAAHKTLRKLGIS